MSEAERAVGVFTLILAGISLKINVVTVGVIWGLGRAGTMFEDGVRRVV